MADAPRTPRLSKATAYERLKKARARRDHKLTEARRRLDREMWSTAVTVQDAAGLTQREVAEALGFHRDTVRTGAAGARSRRDGKRQA